MRALVAALIGALLLVGCSSDAAPKQRAPVKKETKQAEQTASPQAESADAVRQYKGDLQTQMMDLKTNLDTTVVNETNDLMMAAKMYYALDSGLTNIETMDVPDPLKEKHQNLVTNLQTAKYLLSEAQSDFTNSDSESGNAKVEQAMESITRAESVLSEILKSPSQ
ncbi:hypothetical protein H1164_16170 [Thermoactinomyces daqus]|uniref:Lipoprotein n=1 Tax=Thermoactinomyces daqus TaxID=1329516 RepID=A0A7W1XCZ1_9BACL|nr:hypothetical protein [Thermoactinomyces daqus]MBA4544384.1 hypothetical protein [Thermoactinomyces daqus]